ncbi:MAG: TIGR04372 family glycosyltransferase [Candidatus Omnitrophica bacterium]|nr:TIGR04372 family glycosyltransferase [Candidatus Omnitrophota bacterium]
MSNTEVYLCERDLGIRGQRGLDIFYINSSVCNKQLKRMWSRVLYISLFATGLDLLNRALPGGDKHRIPYRNYQDRDIYGVLESTKVHISFTSEEERIGRALLKKIGIGSESTFICFLSRNSAYLDAKFPKGNWHYHDYRDSNIKNFIPAVEELTRRGYFAVRMGAVVNEELKTENPMIIDYAVKHRTDFLDIYMGAKCNFYLGDSCGFHAIPMIFRRPLAIVNMIPLEWATTWGLQNLFISKKLWLCKEHRLLTFREILSSEIGRIGDGWQYEQLGIEVIENTPEEITALAIEMDQRLKGQWQAAEGDEELQQRFWSLFKSSELNGVFLSRIGAEFLRQNKTLLE